jgi:FKBP-type peptidyl-prolyl cis-trans isomerase FkpA
MTLSFRLRSLSLVALLIGLSACGSSSPIAPDQSNIPFSQIDLTLGTGATANPGNTVTVQESAWLYSDTAVDHKGTQFDNESFTFLLGGGQLIVGFDKGVTGMQVGGLRRLIIPPALAYGITGSSSGSVTIPPNAALVFDVTLIQVQ